MDAKMVKLALTTACLFIVMTIGDSKIVDMTHYLNSKAAHFYRFRDFESEVVINKSLGYRWAFANNFYMCEHTGSHIDAPAHTYHGGRLLSKIPVTDLMGPLVIFDLRGKAKLDLDYALTVQDIKDHEREYGRILNGSIVFINTGGAEVYWDRKKYYGTETPEVPASWHWPGFGAPATDFLIRERKIKGIGTDRKRFEVGQAEELSVHVSVSSQDTWGLENLNRVGELPARGAAVFVMPILLEGGSGGPVRVIAYTDIKEINFYPSCSLTIRGGMMVIIMSIMSLLLIKY